MKALTILLIVGVLVIIVLFNSIVFSQTRPLIRPEVGPPPVPPAPPVRPTPPATDEIVVTEPVQLGVAPTTTKVSNPEYPFVVKDGDNVSETPFCLMFSAPVVQYMRVVVKGTLVPDYHTTNIVVTLVASDTDIPLEVTANTTTHEISCRTKLNGVWTESKRGNTGNNKMVLFVADQPVTIQIVNDELHYSVYIGPNFHMKYSYVYGSRIPTSFTVGGNIKITEAAIIRPKCSAQN